MANKSKIIYRTRILVLDGSAEDRDIIGSNTAIENALNDPAMYDDGF